MANTLALLSDRDLALADAIAHRVCEMLAERDTAPAPAGLVDAQTLARILGVSRALVYERAAELGAVRVGDGQRPRIRFDVERARQAWSVRDTSGRSQAPELPAAAGVRRRGRRAAAPDGAGLLPVKGLGDV